MDGIGFFNSAQLFKVGLGLRTNVLRIQGTALEAVKKGDFDQAGKLLEQSRAEEKRAKEIEDRQAKLDAKILEAARKNDEQKAQLQRKKRLEYQVLQAQAQRREFEAARAKAKARAALLEANVRKARAEAREYLAASAKANAAKAKAGQVKASTPVGVPNETNQTHMILAIGKMDAAASPTVAPATSVSSATPVASPAAAATLAAA